MRRQRVVRLAGRGIAAIAIAIAIAATDATDATDASAASAATGAGASAFARQRSAVVEL